MSRSFWREQKKNFETGKKSFKIYRENQCDLAAAMAMGGGIVHMISVLLALHRLMMSARINLGGQAI